MSDPVWFFHNSLSSPHQRGGTVLTITSDDYDDFFGAGNNWITPHYLRRFFGFDKSGIGRWSSSGGDSKFYFAKYADTEIIGTSEVNSWSNNLNYPATNSQYTVAGASTTVHPMASQQGWVKSHELSGSYIVGGDYGSRLRKEMNITQGNFDLCRQDQVPMIDPYSKYYINADYRTPRTLQIADLSDSRKRGNGYTPQPTNGNVNLVSNEYINIKEKMKELMFLPTSFKKDLIQYFEDWGSSIREATSQNGWLRTLDPLNWEKEKGLSYFNQNFQAEWKDWSKTKPNPDDEAVTQPGYNGYMDVGITQLMLDGNISDNGAPSEGGGTAGGWFSGVDKKYNLWYNAYGADSNPKRTNSPNPPSNAQNHTPAQYAYGYTPNTGFNGCFVAGTKILLSNGKYKNIEEIIENDIIASYDIENKIIEESPIEGVKLDYSSDIIKIYLENGITVKSTSNHPYFVKDKGIAKYKIDGETIDVLTNKQLAVGDKIYFYVNGEMKFIKIEKIVELSNKVSKVWNLQGVTKNNNFIANNILVHNVKP